MSLISSVNQIPSVQADSPRRALVVTLYSDEVHILKALRKITILPQSITTLLGATESVPIPDGISSTCFSSRHSYRCTTISDGPDGLAISGTITKYGANARESMVTFKILPAQLRARIKDCQQTVQSDVHIASVAGIPRCYAIYGRFAQALSVNDKPCGAKLIALRVNTYGKLTGSTLTNFANEVVAYLLRFERAG